MGVLSYRSVIVRVAARPIRLVTSEALVLNNVVFEGYVGRFVRDSVLAVGERPPLSAPHLFFERHEDIDLRPAQVAL